ncbi:FxSxx-COOH system tetratricopeptide repeat protein [Phytohabitans sp. LJ34]|uniref:FxSxx-COOH system tetratricopeptide repeat protein n=1 Tax=Phytohabitans sp. LJ34 TaxID=3452217 RepID=UPI003F8991E1
MLRGTALTRWVKVECVVRQLADWAVNRRDPDEEVRRFHRLWLAASDPTGESASVEAHTAPSPPGRAAEPRSTRALVTNLPGRNPAFTGRDGVLAQVREALLRAPRVPLALYGLAGVGKTQLAAEYAHRWADDYDVVWWVPAEHPSQAVAALAALGERLDLPDATDIRQAARAVLDALETSALRWLVVYDNADLREDVAPLLPSAGGHTIVTSRNPVWAASSGSLAVDVFRRGESIAFLRGTGAAGSVEDFDQLAERLGDLPLALAQVRSMQKATGMPVAEYLRLFAAHMDDLLSTGRPTGSPANVVALVDLAFTRLANEVPAAAQLLEILAFMAPDPVSLVVLRSGRDGEIAPPLSRVLYQPDALERIVGEIGRFGLARLDLDSQRIQVHRLVQLVLRERLSADETSRIRGEVHRLLGAANPGDPDNPVTWTMHAEVGTHLLASDAINSSQMPARTAVLDQIRYLERVGDLEASARLGRAAVDAWSRPPDAGGLGADHELTTLATRHLAYALLALGHYDDVRSMIFETLASLRESPHYGPDHSHTLAMVTIAAYFLRVTGDYRQALALDEDRVDRLRRLYGPQHVRTLNALSNLAVNLRLTGEISRAHEIDAKLVETLRSRYGDEDPRTFVSIRNLARNLYDLGRYQEAHDLQRRYVPMMAQRQGNRSDDLLRAGRTVAIALRKLGEHGAAVDEARRNYQASQQRFGPDHEHTLAAMMSYANALRTVGDPIGARSLATEALARYRRIFGDLNPHTLAAAANLAAILRALDRWREAHRVDERTFDEMRRVLGPDHPYTLVVATGLATGLAHGGLHEAAAALGERTLDALRRVRGTNHPETWACAANLALDVSASGDQKAGEARRREAVDELGRLLGPAHPDVRRAERGERIECDIEPPPT